MLIPGFNNASINSPAPFERLAPRLQYFTTAPGGTTGAPTGLSLVGRAVTLTWSGSAGTAPITYVADVGSANGLSNILTGAPLGSGTSITVAAPPGAYYVRLRAQNACGTSAPSAEQLIVVP